MKQIFQLVVTKSFLVTIEAENEQDALELSDFFTSDIEDKSSENNRKEYNFRINNIENKFTQVQILETNE